MTLSDIQTIYFSFFCILLDIPQWNAKLEPLVQVHLQQKVSVLFLVNFCQLFLFKLYLSLELSNTYLLDLFQEPVGLESSALIASADVSILAKL